MDKFEYKVRAEEIKELITRGEYAQAAEIADTIDWRRVKSVMMLCTVSDLYKINKRYEDARDMLLLAYDRHPGGRMILYSLCELCIKLDEILEAVEYYKEFIRTAPRDSGRFVLQYKLYQAQDVSLEDRIGVLEELKRNDYREKWAYELACLYHKAGDSARCVAECDELILWFGEGRYVYKAMELKMQYQPLSAQQQLKYDSRFAPRYEELQPAEEMPQEEVAPEQVPQDEVLPEAVSEAELPENMIPEEVIPENVVTEEWTTEQLVTEPAAYEEAVREETEQMAEEELPDGDLLPEEETAEEAVAEESDGAEMYVGQQEALDIQVKTVDVGQFNTINLQLELAEGLKEVLDDLPVVTEEPAQEEFPADHIVGEETAIFEEEQIEGQLSLDDLMVEWERLKKEAKQDTDEQPVEEKAEEPAEEPETVAFAEEDYGQVEELAEIEETPESLYEEAAELLLSEEPVEEDAPEQSATEEVSEFLFEGEILYDVLKEENREETETFSEAADTKVSDPEKKEEEEGKPHTAHSSGKSHTRNLTREEKELFGSYIQSRLARQKLITALDRISLAACTGNVIVTGEEGMDILEMSKNVIRNVKLCDSNYSGRTAKISATSLNEKDVHEILEQLANGSLIIEGASEMSDSTVKKLCSILHQNKIGIIVVLADVRKKMNKFLASHKELEQYFNARIDMEAMSNEELANYAKKYAYEQEYSIDDLGILALHTRIDEMQTLDHAVSVQEVQQIVDEAIRHANRKTIGHFLDVLLAKRYDAEDMIILREEDFV